jgi:hypothetical protein
MKREKQIESKKQRETEAIHDKHSIFQQYIITFVTLTAKNILKYIFWSF